MIKLFCKFKFVIIKSDKINLEFVVCVNRYSKRDWEVKDVENSV